MQKPTLFCLSEKKHHKNIATTIFFPIFVELHKFKN